MTEVCWEGPVTDPFGREVMIGYLDGYAEVVSVMLYEDAPREALESFIKHQAMRAMAPMN